MGLVLHCDKCGWAFKPDDRVNVFRNFSYVPRLEAMHMYLAPDSVSTASDTDFHICENCLESVFKCLEGR